MERRAGLWLALNAGMWLVVGGGGMLLVQRLLPRPPTLADLADAAAQRLEVLDLRPEQEAELARIRANWRDQIVSGERTWLERVDQAAAEADRQVEALLDATQRQRYRDLALGVRSK
jgi:hypothetical protein